VKINRFRTTLHYSVVEYIKHCRNNINNPKYSPGETLTPLFFLLFPLAP
jgi:hypothetical protein